MTKEEKMALDLVGVAQVLDDMCCLGSADVCREAAAMLASEDDDGEPSLIDEVQTVLRMLDEWAADHRDEAVFFRCRQRLRAAWRKAKGGA